MKAYLFVLVILISGIKSYAQSQIASNIELFKNNTITDWVKPPTKIYCALDTVHMFYFEHDKDYINTDNLGKNAAWSARLDKDTVIFETPPKHMILGNTSYTSIFLNGHWYFLMDYNTYVK